MFAHRKRAQLDGGQATAAARKSVRSRRPPEGEVEVVGSSPAWLLGLCKDQHTYLSKLPYDMVMEMLAPLIVESRLAPQLDCLQDLSKPRFQCVSVHDRWNSYLHVRSCVMDEQHTMELFVTNVVVTKIVLALRRKTTDKDQYVALHLSPDPFVHSLAFASKAGSAHPNLVLRGFNALSCRSMISVYDGDSETVLSRRRSSVLVVEFFGEDSAHQVFKITDVMNNEYLHNSFGTSVPPAGSIMLPNLHKTVGPFKCASRKLAPFRNEQGSLDALLIDTREDSDTYGLPLFRFQQVYDWINEDAAEAFTEISEFKADLVLDSWQQAGGACVPFEYRQHVAAACGHVGSSLVYVLDTGMRQRESQRDEFLRVTTVRLDTGYVVSVAYIDCASMLGLPTYFEHYTTRVHTFHVDCRGQLTLAYSRIDYNGSYGKHDIVSKCRARWHGGVRVMCNYGNVLLREYPAPMFSEVAETSWGPWKGDVTHDGELVIFDNKRSVALMS